MLYIFQHKLDSRALGPSGTAGWNGHKKYANTEVEKYEIVSKQCSAIFKCIHIYVSIYIYTYRVWLVLNLWNKLNFPSLSLSLCLSFFSFFHTLSCSLSCSYHECYIIVPKRWLDFGPYFMPYGPDIVFPPCPQSVQLTVTVFCENCEEKQHLSSKFNLSLEPKVAKC